MTPSSRLLECVQGPLPLWMGIVNVTPDSFSDGGQFDTVASALVRADELVKAGAIIVDVGGVSTRPGSQSVSSEQECHRVLPLLKSLRQRLPASCFISLDTFRPSVAQAAAEQGYIDLINDVCAGRHTENCGLTTVQVAARYELGLILMHMQGEPRTMQQAPSYKDCVGEVVVFLRQAALAARKLGVKCVWIDPGIGFGKTTAHNCELLSVEGMRQLTSLGFPLLIGLSRKRFLGELFATDAVDMRIPVNRDMRTKELELLAVQRGAAVIRSHRMPSEGCL